MQSVSVLAIVSVMLLVDGAHAGFSWRSGSAYKSNPPSQASKSSYIGDTGSQQSGRGKLANSSDSKTAEKTTRSFGISAWGIIGTIVGAISVTTVAYYTFTLYPYLCKKERCYDMMELSDVV